VKFRLIITISENHYKTLIINDIKNGGVKFDYS